MMYTFLCRSLKEVIATREIDQECAEREVIILEKKIKQVRTKYIQTGRKITNKS